MYFAQLSLIVDILNDDLEMNPFFNELTCSSHQEKPPASSTESAETKVVCATIDRARLLSSIYNITVPVQIALDSHYFDTFLSAQKHFFNRTVRAEISFTRCKFKTQNTSSLVWIL